MNQKMFTSPNVKSTLENKISELRSVSDKLGMPIDEHIIETVAALNILGIPTDASCEGHDENGRHPFPYVWIYEPEPRLGTDKEKVDTVEKRNLKHQERIKSLLDEFYSNRNVDKYLKIKMLLLARNSIYLTSQDREDINYIKPKLEDMQKEFRDFTEFLKTKI